MKHFLICAGLMCPVAALAQCPTVADMQTGIRFSVDHTDSETFRTLGPGLVEAIYRYEDGYSVRSLLGQGVYLLELVDLVDGAPDISTRTTYGFPQNAEDLPVPQPGASLSFDVVMNEAGSLNRDTQVYSVGSETVQVFGTCQYRMLPIEVRYPLMDETTVDLLHYLPELGLAYLAGGTYEDGSSVYTYHAIEAVQ
jgi:hypothetical protein